MNPFNVVQPSKKKNHFDTDTYLLNNLDRYYKEDKSPIGNSAALGSGKSIDIGINHVFIFNGANKIPFSAIIKGEDIIAKYK